MSKKALVLAASPRKNGNSDILCDQFIKGVADAGHIAEKIYIKDKKIDYCIGCDACKRKVGTCIHKDDMGEITQKMIEADVIVLATPVYFYSMDAQLKTLIDRTYSRYMEMKNKEVYLIVTGAADATHYLDTTVAGLRGFIICLSDAKEKGVIYGINTYEAGTVKETPAMQEAYEMGKSI